MLQIVEMGIHGKKQDKHLFPQIFHIHLIELASKFHFPKLYLLFPFQIQKPVPRPMMLFNTYQST